MATFVCIPGAVQGGWIWKETGTALFAPARALRPGASNDCPGVDRLGKKGTGSRRKGA